MSDLEELRAANTMIQAAGLNISLLQSDVRDLRDGQVALDAKTEAGFAKVDAGFTALTALLTTLIDKSEG